MNQKLKVNLFLTFWLIVTLLNYMRLRTNNEIELMEEKIEEEAIMEEKIEEEAIENLIKL